MGQQKSSRFAGASAKIDYGGSWIMTIYLGRLVPSGYLRFVLLRRESLLSETNLLPADVGTPAEALGNNVRQLQIK